MPCHPSSDLRPPLTTYHRVWEHQDVGYHVGLGPMTTTAQKESPSPSRAHPYLVESDPCPPPSGPHFQLYPCTRQFPPRNHPPPRGEPRELHGGHVALRWCLMKWSSAEKYLTVVSSFWVRISLVREELKSTGDEESKHLQCLKLVLEPVKFRNRIPVVCVDRLTLVTIFLFHIMLLCPRIFLFLYIVNECTQRFPWLFKLLK